MGIITQPRLVSTAAGHNAWIAVILGAIVPLLSLVLIEKLGKRFPHMDFTAMSHALFGKFLGTGLAMVFIFYIIIFEAAFVYRFASLISLFLLPQTPLPVICFMILAGTVYIASKGAQVVGRLNELFFYLLLPLFLFLIPPLFMHGDYINLLPVGETSISQMLQGTFFTFYDYGRMDILMLAYFMVTRKDEVLKAGLGALTLVVLSYVFVTASCLLVFGSENIQNQLYPLLTLLNSVSIPVLERMDLLFMFLWSVAFRPVINATCMASFSATRLFQLDVKKYYPLVVAGSGLIIYLLTFIPRDLYEALEFSYITSYIFVAFGLGYPLLYLAVAFRQGKKVKQVV